MSTNNLHVVFHVARMGEFWREVVGELVGYLNGSGLHNEASSLTAVMVGPIERDFLPFDDNKWTIHEGGGLEQYEYPSLEHVRRIAKRDPGSFILYIHTKGVRIEEGRTYRAQWRRYMAHWLITRWRESIEKLEDGYDVVGSILHKAPYPPHYSGNFWWATASHLSSLPVPAPQTFDSNRRAWAEFWLMASDPKPAAFCWGPELPDLLADYWKSLYGDPLPQGRKLIR